MDMVDFIIIFYSIMAAATMGLLYYGFRQIEQVEDAAEKSAEELQAVRDMLERMERGQAPHPKPHRLKQDGDYLTFE
ncbi:hypothetical protein [uncultured Dialister sp.]|uniref:hypothetical protein n=1 Tax=uncultured Dialister sp. TaxID=278064 RepID=UPI0025945229|nr:hypothetical protein [uncultured Dialister sp.]